LDLFVARNPLGLDRAFTTAKRSAIDTSSWIELVPAWMRGGEELLQISVAQPPIAERLPLEERVGRDDLDGRKGRVVADKETEPEKHRQRFNIEFRRRALLNGRHE